jgi:hypothetical protein
LRDQKVDVVEIVAGRLVLAVEVFVEFGELLAQVVQFAAQAVQFQVEQLLLLVKLI